MKIGELSRNIGLQIDLGRETPGFLQRPLVPEAHYVGRQNFRVRDISREYTLLLAFSNKLQKEMVKFIDNRKNVMA